MDSKTRNKLTRKEFDRLFMKAKHKGTRYFHSMIAADKFAYDRRMEGKVSWYKNAGKNGYVVDWFW